MKGTIYVFQLPSYPCGCTMDDIVVDIVGETSTHYKVQKSFGDKLYSNWIKKEDVEIIWN